MPTFEVAHNDATATCDRLEAEGFTDIKVSAWDGGVYITATAPKARKPKGDETR